MLVTELPSSISTCFSSLTFPKLQALSCACLALPDSEHSSLTNLLNGELLADISQPGITSCTITPTSVSLLVIPMSPFPVCLNHVGGIYVSPLGVLSLGSSAD